MRLVLFSTDHLRGIDVHCSVRLNQLRITRSGKACIQYLRVKKAIHTGHDGDSMVYLHMSKTRISTIKQEKTCQLATAGATLFITGNPDFHTHTW